MGRRRKLPQLEILEGNPTKRPILGEFIEAHGLPFIPEHLRDDAQGCMEVMIASMPDKVYSQADTYTLAAFASAWATHRRAEHEIASPDFQWIIESRRGLLQPNPWLRVLDKQAMLLASLGDRLGANPAARLKLRLPEERPRSKFDGLLGQSGS
jgi:phage terminase small subunit